jgi:hypothetical protein
VKVARAFDLEPLSLEVPADDVLAIVFDACSESASRGARVDAMLEHIEEQIEEALQ